MVRTRWPSCSRKPVSGSLVPSIDRKHNAEED
jgi:hypothetical protein